MREGAWLSIERNTDLGLGARLSRTDAAWEIGLFCACGGAQLLVDWLAFVSLSALGAGVVAANLSGRTAGALVGFLLNGQVTFRMRASASGWVASFIRFVVTWSLLTTASTLALVSVRDAWGLEAAWRGKVFIEAGLAAVSFLALKFWVYRQVTHGSR